MMLKYASGNLDNRIYKDIWIYMNKSWINTDYYVTDMFGYMDIFLLSWKDLSKKDIQTRYP